jgi:hypothetical protein
VNPRSPLNIVAVVAFLAAAPRAMGDYQSAIGLTTLRTHGYLIADGEDVDVGQVEAPNGGVAPNIRDPEFRWKDFEFEGIPATVSPHATRIGKLIYGNSSGIAPKVEDVYAFSDKTFVGTSSVKGLLNPGQGRKPGKLDVDVLNNSWIGTFNNHQKDVVALRRLDYAIWRDDVVVVNSASNTDSLSSPFPTLMASSYNGITVGRTAGGRVGPTTVDGGVGRAKPDLVAPMGTTSDAAAVVSGAAALLLSEAEARHMEPGSLAIKAALLAGAYRPADWSRGGGGGTGNDGVGFGEDEDGGPSLSYKYGAGELRVHRAFHVLTAGEQKEGKAVWKRGWSEEKLSSSSKYDYYDLKYSTATPEFTAVLTWHRRFTKRGSSYDNLSPVLADLELELLRKVGNKWTSVAGSDSSQDNVEMLAIDNLPAGQYRLTVAGPKHEEYALAWDADYNPSARRFIPPEGTSLSRDATSAATSLGAPVPEPSCLLWLSALALVVHRRRRCRA